MKCSSLFDDHDFPFLTCLAWAIPFLCVEKQSTARQFQWLAWFNIMKQACCYSFTFSLCRRLDVYFWFFCQYLFLEYPLTCCDLSFGYHSGAQYSSMHHGLFVWSKGIWLKEVFIRMLGQSIAMHTVFTISGLI